MDGGLQLIVVTERLGWPPDPKGWRRFVPWEVQDRIVYDDQPGEPTATCHMQPHSEAPALCGHPWEILITVPGSPAWSDLHPDLRCDACSAAAGDPEEDPAGRRYRHHW